jgi:hypothetical protein
LLHAGVNTHTHTHTYTHRGRERERKRERKRGKKEKERKRKRERARARETGLRRRRRGRKMTPDRSESMRIRQSLTGVRREGRRMGGWKGKGRFLFVAVLPRISNTFACPRSAKVCGCRCVCKFGHRAAPSRPTETLLSVPQPSGVKRESGIGLQRVV